MKKKIRASDLRIGMYVEKLDGNWLQHPFWKNAFNLVDPKDIKAIHDSGIKYAWINTSKGCDVESTPENITTEAITPESPPATKQVSLEDELELARVTLEKAREKTLSMFQEARMGNSIKIAEAASLVEEISQSVARNPGAMLSLTRMKNQDNYTYLHSVAVCALMIALGKQINYQGNMQSLGMAGLLHDVGKMAIPDKVLNKPGKLTDEEFKIIQDHPLRGWEMLKESPDVDEISLDVCLHHHERIDGKGYPDKLNASSISLEAKMGAICDVYDAITSDRCYKKGWEAGEALKKMAEWKDGHFDECIFNAFVKTIGIYPTGTLIKLKSGRLAIVTEQSAQTLLKPQIKIFFSCNSRTLIPTKTVDLMRSNEVIESIEKPETWGLNREKVMSML